MTTATKAKRDAMIIEGQAAQLLSHLWRGGAHSFYWTSAGKRSLWVDPVELGYIPAGWADKNVYFGVHPCRDVPPTNGKGKTAQKQFIRSQIEQIAAVNCLFAEFDAKDYGSKEAIRAHLDANLNANRAGVGGFPWPSVIIDSGGGWHCYWLLEHTVTVTDANREHLKRLQAAWVELVGSDSGAKDLVRVLRLPGTLNVKPEYGPDFPTVTIVEADFRRLYDLAEFETLTHGLRNEPLKSAQNATQDPSHGQSGALPGDAEVWEVAFSGPLGDVVRSLYNGDLSAHGGNHSAADYALCKHLAYLTNSDPFAIDRLFRQSALTRDKWAGRADYREATMDKAIKSTTKHFDWSTRRNGHGPGAALDLAGAGTPSAADIGLTGDGNETGKPNTKTSFLEKLLADLAAIDAGNPQAKMLFAWEQIRYLTLLDDDRLKVFRAALHNQGVTADWVEKTLLPAIEQEHQRKAEEADRESGSWTAILSVCHGLGYSFRLNELADSMEIKRGDAWERMSDVHEATLLSELHAMGFKYADVARRAILAGAGRERFHPVKAYLAGLEWDGEDHIAALAGYFEDAHGPITYADGTRRAVFHALFRRWLVGAVGKVYDSTLNQNPMLILAGGQGKGKSYFAKWLCPLHGLQFEGAIKPEDKDYLGYLATKWIWEVGELGATMRKADREALKAFITQQEATFRPAYGRYPKVKPALTSFIGTVNPEGALLADPTGNRRFRIVELVKEGQSIDWRYAGNIDLPQLWAQAKALYAGGVSWQLSAEENAVHEKIIELYEVEDILAGYVQDHFRVEPDNSALFTHTTSIISTLRNPNGADVKGSERGLSMQLSSTLVRLGLVKAKRDNRWGYLGIARRMD